MHTRTAVPRPPPAASVYFKSALAACRAFGVEPSILLHPLDFLGRDDVPFSVTWPRTMGNPDVTREFTGFWQLADQQARSRIHGGIHFQFDSDGSQAACVKVPEFTDAHYMLPREGRRKR